MATARASETPYFNAINVTPFIDVLLVLLIVIIMSLPLATHKLPVDLPSGPSTTAIDEPHMLRIDRSGALFVDGRAIADGALPATLRTIRDRPGAVLQMHTDPEAQYARFDEVLAVVKHAGITRLGFVGHAALVD
ncbi:MAG: biopolymer transporter ExbD [Sphingomonadales bacterium]|nr:MAG: biopolymer transporter ExbD [Sphingomonadales bacterium]